MGVDEEADGMSLGRGGRGYKKTSQFRSRSRWLGDRSQVPRQEQSRRRITLGGDGEESSFALNSGNTSNLREVESDRCSQRNGRKTSRMRVIEAQRGGHFQEGVWNQVKQ